MKNITPFQLAILAIFSVTGILGVIFLATFKVDPIPEEEKIGNVAIWGTYDGQVMRAWLQELSKNNENLRGISYRELSPTVFDREVLEALAEQRAPDLLLLDNTQLFDQYNRIFALDSSVLPRSQFRNTFLELSEVYVVPEGVLGLPVFADPLVMFWNRTMFQSEGEVKPPVSWQDFFRILPIFTQVSDNLTISRTALPLGEAVNINHFKEILMTLVLQAGNPVTQKGEFGYESVLSGSRAFPSGLQALQFFTEFSNPTKDSYSWNRSLPSSQDYFLAGKSAVYLGFASEIRPLQLKNPNLNFDVAEIPQSASTESKSVYAKLYGLFIPSQAQNKTGSYRAMSVLTSQDALEKLQNIIKLSVVRRDLAAQTASDDLFTDIFRREAIYAKTYIDPQDSTTNNITGTMIETITSGRRSIQEAITLFDQEVQVLFNN